MKPERTRAPVVVLGLNRHPGLQAARILTARGVPVIGMATDPKHPNCRTRACAEIVYADSEANYVQRLEALGRRLQDKAILMPCSDALVMMVSASREQLAPWYHILLPDAEVVDMLMNKVEFYRYAGDNGFRIPQTHYVRSGDDLERAISALSFPVVVKPPNRAGAWSDHTTAKIFKLDDQGALRAFYEERRSWADTLIMQESVEGPDANLVSVNLYCGADSEPLATFVSRKVRQWPPGAGDSCYGEEARDDEALAETIRLFRSVGYRGLGYLELKRDERNNKLFIIEPNVGRPTGRSAIAEAGGVDLLLTMYNDATRQPLPLNRIQRYGSARWIHLRKDLQDRKSVV